MKYTEMDGVSAFWVGVHWARKTEYMQQARDAATPQLRTMLVRLARERNHHIVKDMRRAAASRAAQ